ADGLTNRQIAGKMYLSLSTIKKELSCAYDKLGITCRRQLKELF
ncbi:MAG: LuxR family transcriptional regulator, partial [Clostridiales bacterium]|nr:LuxR family transcriptional regulator [Clostridiales bacterium]NLG57435.1 LuxR family transcriptional regulator [Clostridiales bacterium]